MAVKDKPREISPLRTFESLVDEMVDLFAAQQCPGGIMGISGTDSILTYLICDKAFRSLGMAGKLTGVYYGQAHDAFAKVAIPYLSAATHSKVTINDEVGQGRNDGARWGDLIDRALLTPLWSYRPADERLWVIGTRNKTEEALGTYSNSTKIASVQPISVLWKSEVLEICKAMNVPAQIISRAYIADCGCGDMDADLLAMNPRLTDVLLMQFRSELSLQYRGDFPQEMVADVSKAILRQFKAAGFKDIIPYAPSNDAVVCRPEAA